MTAPTDDDLRALARAGHGYRKAAEITGRKVAEIRGRYHELGLEGRRGGRAVERELRSERIVVRVTPSEARAAEALGPDEIRRAIAEAAERAAREDR